jgi:hypothetical protein
LRLGEQAGTSSLVLPTSVLVLRFSEDGRAVSEGIPRDSGLVCRGGHDAKPLSPAVQRLSAFILSDLDDILRLSRLRKGKTRLVKDLSVLVHSPFPLVVPLSDLVHSASPLVPPESDHVHRRERDPKRHSRRPKWSEQEPKDGERALKRRAHQVSPRARGVKSLAPHPNRHYLGM